MRKRDEKIYNDPWERDFYETGSTRPPKDRGGLVAILLILVILLGGTCSALGIINLHLLQQLAHQEETPGTLNVFDTAPDQSFPTPIGESDDSIGFARMGMEGQTVSDFDRRFYDLPQGVLITGVTDGSPAQLAGLHPGDVIILLDSLAVSTQEELEYALAQFPAGQPIAVAFYRHQTGKEMNTQITLSEE